MPCTSTARLACLSPTTSNFNYLLSFMCLSIILHRYFFSPMFQWSNKKQKRKHGALVLFTCGQTQKRLGVMDLLWICQKFHRVSDVVCKLAMTVNNGILKYWHRLNEGAFLLRYFSQVLAIERSPFEEGNKKGCSCLKEQFNLNLWSIPMLKVVKKG